MSFPRYPAYKESGITWLREVPEHWHIRRIRWLCQIKKRIVGELGYHVLSITQRGIRVKDLESNEGQLSMDYSKYQLVEPGDFAMNHMDLLTGWVDISDRRGVTSPDYRVFSLRDPIACSDRYLLYLLQMGYSLKVLYAYGQGSSQLGRWRLPTEQFNELRVPLPRLTEQTAIVEFLDRETAKIDALIAEQEQLIAHLQEKRQAVISQAVTKGLNLSASRKPSGVEWLGEVPSHWSVEPLKRSWSVTDCKHLTAVFVEDGIPLASIREVQSWYVDLTNAKKTTEEYYLQLIEGGRAPIAGDLIFSRNATVGEVAQVPLEPIDFAMGQDVCLLRRLNREASPDFMQFVIRSSVVMEQLETLMIGSTFRRANVEDIRGLVVPVPPAAEQRQIAEHLALASGRFDALADEAVRAAGLLQERRSALISAAVTGQIDVRGLIYQEAA